MFKAKSLIVIVLGSIFSLLAFFLPFIASWIGILETIDAKLQFFLGIGMTLTTIIVAYLRIIIDKQDNNFSELHPLLKKMALDRVEILDHKQKYVKLKELVKIAEKNINLMYLSPKPPNELERSKERESYFKAIDEVIKKCDKKEITVTRVIFFSENNKNWIKKDIIDKYGNYKFFSLFFIKNVELHMSIQTIDEDHTIVISNLDDDMMIYKKHFYAFSKGINNVYNDYYRSFLSDDNCIIKNGQKQCNYNSYFNS